MHKLLLMSLVIMAGLNHSAAHGHFPWLVRGDDGKVAYFFGEDVTDRTYKLPASMTAAKVHRVKSDGELEAISLTGVERADLIGLESAGSVPPDSVLVSEITFGIHRGARLQYYTVHQGGALPTRRTASNSVKPKHDLTAELVDTDGGVDVYVCWKGKPAQGLEVHLYCDKGHEEGTATSDAEGKVSFTDKQVEPGLNALMLGHSLTETGKFNDQEYESSKHYLTVTFFEPTTSASATDPASKLAPLPIGLTSFGAARAGDAIYVYGGHTGKAHAYSNRSQSNKLLKLELSKPDNAWQQVAEGEGLQGLGMVAYQHRLIMLGGFTADNAEGEAHDLHSQTAVHVYDLASQSWSELPPLPEARSSHDAAVIGSTIYVVGGWNMTGEDATAWHTSACSLDLEAADPKWVELPRPPFQRRALAVVAHEGKLFAIGGMSQESGPTKAVSVYDPQTRSWSDVAEILGDQAMAGFGAAGCSINGQLVVTTYEGAVQIWDHAQQNWTMIGRTKDARFFHRLLPFSNKQLVSVGGANMDSGKFLEPEVVNLP